MKKILESSFLLSASNLLGRFISFGAVIIITRALNLYEYGALTLAMTVSAPINLLSSFGLESVIVSDMARFRGELLFGKLKKLIRSYTLSKLLLTTIFIAIGWYFKPFLVARYGNLVNDYYLLLTLWIYANIGFTIINAIVNAYEKFKALAISDVLEVVFKLVFIVSFWIGGILNVQYVLLAYVLSKILVTAFLTIVALYSTYHLRNVEASREPVLRKIIFEHGKWDIMSQTIFQQTDTTLRPWIIKFFVGNEGVALFSVARSVYTALIGLIPIKQILFPLFARNLADKEKNIILAQKASKYSVIVYLIVGSIAFFGISPFIHIFFAQYEASILLFRILLIRMVITGASYGQPAFFYAYREQKILFWFNCLNILSLFTLLPLLMKLFALPGAYIERIIVLLLVYIGRELYLRKKYQILTWRFRALIEYDNYDKNLIREIIKRIKSILGIKNKAYENID